MLLVYKSDVPSFCFSINEYIFASILSLCLLNFPLKYSKLCSIASLTVYVVGIDSYILNYHLSYHQCVRSLPLLRYINRYLNRVVIQ
jgi:hypothetical protein